MLSELNNRPSSGVTIWLTGLSGAGKSTLANALCSRMINLGKAVEVLDGDKTRVKLSPSSGFSRNDRREHVLRVGHVAMLLSRNNVVSIVPVIAPYDEFRKTVRKEHIHENVPFILIYLSTSLEACSRRDVKGLYRAQLEGNITGLTGVDDPYEVPADADLELDTDLFSLEVCVDMIMEAIMARFASSS